MRTNGMIRLVLLSAMSIFTMSVNAQFEQVVKKVFWGDTVESNRSTLNDDSDSIRVFILQKSFDEAKLNEANMRMEMEQMKL